MKKVLLISTKYPFPTDDGKKAVLAGFLAHLVDRFGKDNVSYVVIGAKERGTPSEPACRTLWIAPPGRLTQAWNLFKSVSGVETKSLQEALTYSSRIKRILRDLIGEARPDLLLLDTIRIGQYFWQSETPDCQRVLYMDDLFHLRFRRMLATAATNRGVQFNPAGTFASSLPGLAQALLRIGPLQSLLYRIESVKTERRELESPARFDRCLLINPNEARFLKERCPGGSIFAVKPLLYAEPCASQRKFDGTPSFVLFGSLRHPVYRASVIQFLERSLEKALQSMPQAKIEIVGDGADEQITRLCSRFGSRVAIRGFVQSIDALFSTACALLVPLIAPGGLKLKTLTALYYGLPVVATDSGVDGIPVHDGIHFLRENAVERFPLHMARLCDVSYNREISHNASRIFQEHYSRDRVFEEYDELFAVGKEQNPSQKSGTSISRR